MITFSCIEEYTVPRPHTLLWLHTPTVMEMLSTVQASVGDKGPISVYIIEDHEDYRETIQELINFEEDMYCEYTFDCCEDYLTVFDQIPPPSVLLMDISIPGKMDGIEGTQKIRALDPTIKIVMLTGSNEEDKILMSLSSGAVGYIIKDDEPEVLTSKIREAWNGGFATSPTATRKMQQAFELKLKRRSPQKDYKLTKREVEVLTYMVKKDNVKRKDIAKALYISFPTVDAHIQNIYRKLDVNTNVEAIKKALDEGLTD